MSTIYFHSLSGEAEVRRPERHWAGHVTNEIGLAALIGTDPSLDDLHRIAAMIRRAENRGGRVEPRYVRLQLAVNAHEVDFVLPDGRVVNAWHTILNTAIAAGSDPVRLLARIHGQCEIHCFVEGPNRAWLARIVEDGCASGVLRTGMGWERVIGLLRARADEPVVLSYSVTKQFPGRHAGGESIPADYWADMSEDHRWRISMAWLRERKEGLEITPENLGNPKFFGDDGTNAFLIRRQLDSSSKPWQG